ncbi:MAG TPA: PAS domain-containing sensor histidine kinase [Burkholderiales bacterium]|nr:PAS domain-containing sensor histidine kinase [Burkholderiales bacterium]
MDRQPPPVEELVRLTLDQASEHALILLEPGGSVVGWLMGAERVFGYRAQEMRGRPLDVLFTPEDCARGIPALEVETARRQGTGENDRWLVRKDGLRIFVTGVMTRLTDGQGRVLGFSKIVRDRTDMRAQIDNLRNQAGAFHVESERKQVLLNTLAHELRTPLAVLSNAAHLVEIAGAGEARLKDATALIRRQVKYLQTLVDDLLELGRVKAAKITLQLERIDLREVVEAALESASASLNERRQRAEIVLPSIMLDGDATRLRQVVVNLLSNASKFSPEGARLWIKGTTEDGEAVLRFIDEGHGIPTDLLPRVFDLFTQGSIAHGSGQPGAGLGLGLSLVKEYVELHGGRVQVRSEGPGRGSEFIVRLPLPQPPK